MKIKKIITGGCSFSDSDHRYTWPHQFESYIRSLGHNVDFEHLGMAAQGQELIQKKASLALVESLEKYAPEEIAVIVMWSGTRRKSFYIDDMGTIEKIVLSWDRPRSLRATKQFVDLKNKFRNKKITDRDRGVVQYDEYGGWYVTRHGIDEEFSNSWFKLNNSIYSDIHMSAENMVMLQNLCKANSVRFYQQYFMDESYYDIELHTDHQLVGYLHKQIDQSTIILKQGMFEYLLGEGYRLELSKKADNPYTYFLSKDDNHPNLEGHQLWVNQIMIPKLEETGFFNE